MRKWRPGHRCVYIIPEICGNINSFELILNRILPLRKFNGQEDDIIMLGSYMDGDLFGPEVLEVLIDIKKEYGARAIFLKGAQEEMFIRAVIGTEKDYKYWVSNKGSNTVNAYIRRANLKSEASSFPQSRLKDIVPKEHLDFIMSLPFFYEKEDFFFFYGGFNYQKPLIENDPISFAFDKNSSRIYKQKWNNDQKLDVEKIMIGSYNHNSKSAVIYPRYFMLGGAGPKKLIVIDLNSMEACAAKRNKSRIYKTKIKILE